MMRLRRHAAWLLTLSAMTVSAQPYSARRTAVDGVSVVELADASRNTTVYIVPSVGNIAYRMEVNGKNVFWFPFDSVKDFVAKPKLSGNPFLAPWANRLDEEAFYANGKKYLLNPELDNYGKDPNGQPIHGLLIYASAWEVISLSASADGAHVTSRLEFSRHADWMAQFPFAHTIEMTYRLREGALEVHTRIENTGAQTMPLSVGYHPYFQLHDAPRDDWTVRLAAENVWTLSDKLIPTGETKPLSTVLGDPGGLPLKGLFLDHVLGGLVRDSEGRASFSVEGASQKIEVACGPKYRAAVVYAPTGKDQNFICFEPMSGITNAFNLAQRGIYKDLQTIPAGQSWEESYWIRPSGF